MKYTINLLKREIEVLRMGLFYPEKVKTILNSILRQIEKQQTKNRNLKNDK